MTERDEALFGIYQSVADRVPFGAEEFARRLDGWDVIPVCDGTEVIGGVLSKGNEIHVGFGKRLKASGRRYIRTELNKTIDKYGFALTSVQPQNSAGLRFCERLGFVKVGESNEAILLRCDRSNYK
jgi:hypothetical protein